MHQDSTWYGGRPQLRRLCVRWGPSPLPPKVGGAPNFSAHVYCGQTAAWMKKPVGTEVGLGPDGREGRDENGREGTCAPFPPCPSRRGNLAPALTLQCPRPCILGRGHGCNTAVECGHGPYTAMHGRVHGGVHGLHTAIARVDGRIHRDVCTSKWTVYTRSVYCTVLRAVWLQNY